MRKTALLLFLFLWFLIGIDGPKLLFAGGDLQISGARRIALGNAFTGVRANFQSLFSNPAGIAGIQQMYAGVNYERRFLLSELNVGSFGFAAPFNELHTIAVEVAGFGNKLYSESRVGLAYGTTILEKVDLGVKLNLNNTAIQNYGSAMAFYLDLGVIVRVTSEFSLGASIFNANQAKIEKEVEEVIPTTFSMGGAYKISDKVMLVADIEKHIDFAWSVRGGVEYEIVKYLKIRAGVQSQPVIISAGLGFVWKELDIDFANSYHEDLGYSPALSASFRFGKKREKTKTPEDHLE